MPDYPQRRHQSASQRLKSPHERSQSKKGEKNNKFTTALHIFIALVIFDCIAETQLKTSTARLYHCPKKTLRQSSNSDSSCPSSPEPPSSQPAFRKSKNPIIVSRPSISCPDSPTSPLSTSSLLKNQKMRASALKSQSRWRTEAQKMLAWVPIDTLEEVIEVVMEILSEASDVI